MSAIDSQQPSEQITVRSTVFMILGILLFTFLLITLGCISKSRGCVSPARDRRTIPDEGQVPLPMYIPRTMEPARTWTMRSDGVPMDLLPPYIKERHIQPSLPS
ncbi:hypothetical protein BOTBODRAFT_186759 [Botryobasidium botryosum FD-172 SS1]|uniref:Uncharacterized protein n=1 Tax=Botryobasidium botryosum (strain FD-172 SS1) TaxID=930990 RepID=A0A067MJU6_BOTB1|nr:hypothetical protein BOTBODRAFT_186759 [Botryobasidium botryosum FD-172 SS1]